METTAFDQENLSTWTRQRQTAELSSFVTRHLAPLNEVDLELS